MRRREWRVGIVGTFDVENYGDLLFPLIAEAELAARLGPVTLHRFSYWAKTADAWPYAVTSITELPRLAPELDALLIGGGFLVRFDKLVAASYGPPSEGIHHPTGYWLTPALIALQHGVPVVWNAPGMHENEVPDWAEPLVTLALRGSAYVAVRDVPSRYALARLAAGDRIAVVPDTGFGVHHLVPQAASSDFARRRADAGLNGRYIVIQPTSFWRPFYRFLRAHADRWPGVRVLALPISPVLGDDAAIADAELPGIARLPFWPEPRELADIIRNAEAVVGHSYHLAITALTAGVPVFTPADMTSGKYSALARFDAIHPLPVDQSPDPEWFASRLRRAAPSPAVSAALDDLRVHWDRVAAVVEAGRADGGVVTGRFWQALPGLLEQSAKARDDAVGAARQFGQGMGALERQHSTDRARIVELESEVSASHQRIALQESELSASHQRIAVQESELSARHQRITLQEVDLSAQRARLATLESECAAHRDRIVAVEAALTVSRERLAAIEVERSKGEELGRKLGELLEQARTELEDTTAALESERSRGRARADTLARQLALARVDAITHRDRLATMLTSRSWRLTASARSVGRALKRYGTGTRLLDADRLARGRLQTEPFEWAVIDGLFTPRDARALADTYPCDHFKTVSGQGGEKDYDYEARALVVLGQPSIAYAADLSRAWRQLAHDLISPAYRAAMSALCGRDLTSAPVEVNVFHYGPGHLLGPHPDLPDKVVTHVLYFNREWDAADGGCLNVLRSREASDVFAEVLPIVGNSAVLVRADHSWHAVSRVVGGSRKSRRSVTVTFYQPGSVSSMWPAGDAAPLHRFE